MTTDYYDIVVSINVHEKPEYLFNQLDNINQYIKFKKFIIILNCNDFMFNELSFKKNILLSKNAIVNPIPINKKTFTGSLTHGIVSNIKYALDNFDFRYFLILSSREFFTKVISIDNDIEKHKITQHYIIKTGNITSNILYKLDDYNVNDWWWPKFKNTKLFNYIKNNKLYFSLSPHESLCFKKTSCEYIVNFLNKNHDIEEDLYNFDGCVEEFSIQSICCNYEPFYHIGNCIWNLSSWNINLRKSDDTKYTVKRSR
jgi:hypothetical protein